MKESLHISFPRILTYAAIERVLHTHFQSSRRSTSTHLDLSAVEWIGYLPASLLLSWALHLTTKNLRVEVSLPSPTRISRQAEKLIIDSSMIDVLKEFGIHTEQEFYRQQKRTPVPFRVLSSRSQIQQAMRAAELSISKHHGQPGIYRATLQTCFQTMTVELVENALVHSNSPVAYFGAQHAISSGGTTGKGIFRNFPKGTPYIEISVGDIGRGIQRKLHSFMPQDYEPPFSHANRRFIKAERVLCYAFEFSSTSDKSARRQRLLELLNDEHLEPSKVATGLFSVMELSRIYGAQMLVRIPEAILSFDYTRNPRPPIIKGKRELGVKLAPLAGTHVLLRVPLKTTSQKSHFTALPDGPSVLPKVRVFDVFKDWNLQDPLSENLQRSLDELDTLSTKHRKSNNVTLLPPPVGPMTSRASAILLNSLQILSNGGHLFIWLGTAGRAVSDQRIDGPPVLCGELETNRFRVFGRLGSDMPSWLISHESGEYSLSGKAHKMLYDLFHTLYIEPYLHRILDSARVRSHPGPFLIENQYYTTTFYRIEKALDEPAMLDAFTAWYSRRIPDDVELVITIASTIKRLVGSIISRLGRHVAVLEWSPSVSHAKMTAETLMYSGKKGLIFTDVVCRGRQVGQILDSIAGVELVQILTLVDAREEKQMLPYRTSAGSISLSVTSVLQTIIRPLHKVPAGYSHVYVIDRHTHAPSQYIRPTAKRGLLEKESSPARTNDGASALRIGHTEHHGRHYQYFLQLPQLFAVLRKSIESWIASHLIFISETVPRTDASALALVHSPDGSLDWLPEYLSSHHEISSSLITDNELAAPIPLAETSRTHLCILITPALASGVTGRQLIEFASRSKPSNILLLSIVCRLEPHELQFMRGIKEYQDSKFWMGIYWELPIKSYRPGPSTCPMCEEHAILRRSFEYSSQKLGNNALFTRLLELKRDSTKPYQLTSSSSSAPTPESSFELAHMRALLDASDVDIDARRALKRLLLSGDVDLFLIMVANERANSIFDRDELERRLYVSYPEIHRRASHILEKEAPPYRVDKLIPALTRIAPAQFVASLPSLLRRYITSLPDLGAICIEMVQRGIASLELGNVLDEARVSGHSEAERLIQQALEVLKEKARQENSAEYDDSISKISRLFTICCRSSPFFRECLEQLSSFDSGYRDVEEVRGLLHDVYRTWRSDVSMRITDATTSHIWKSLMKHDESIANRIGEIDKEVIEMATLREAPDSSFEGLFGLFLSMRANNVIENLQEIGNTISSFCITPLTEKVDELPLELPLQDGATIRVAKDFQRKDIAVQVFCSKADLDAAVGELIGNWVQHSQGISGDARIRIFRDEGEIVFMFEDNLPGKFSLESHGGLRIVHDFARSYCGDFSTGLSSDTFKYVRFTLRIVRG